MATQPQPTTKRDAVTRIEQALQGKGYRCVQHAAQPSGFEFTIWCFGNRSFCLWSNETTQEYEFYKLIETNTVDEDIALL